MFVTQAVNSVGRKPKQNQKHKENNFGQVPSLEHLNLLTNRHHHRSDWTHQLEVDLRLEQYWDSCWGSVQHLDYVLVFVCYLFEPILVNGGWMIWGFVFSVRDAVMNERCAWTSGIWTILQCAHTNKFQCFVFILVTMMMMMVMMNEWNDLQWFCARRK